MITKNDAAKFWAKYFNADEEEALACHHMTIDCMVKFAQGQVKNCSVPDVGVTLPLPDENSIRQIAQHVRNSEESRDPLIYEQGIIRGMQIMKNIVSGN